MAGRGIGLQFGPEFGPGCELKSVLTVFVLGSEVASQDELVARENKIARDPSTFEVEKKREDASVHDRSGP